MNILIYHDEFHFLHQIHKSQVQQFSLYVCVYESNNFFNEMKLQKSAVSYVSANYTLLLVLALYLEDLRITIKGVMSAMFAMNTY